MGEHCLRLFGAVA